MKKILFALLLFASMAHAQTPEISYRVVSIAAMKTYYGNANRIRVTATNEEYVTCSSCTADEVYVFVGAGGRKWQLTPNPFTLRNSKSSGDSLALIINQNEMVIKRLAPGSNFSITKTSDSLLTLAPTGLQPTISLTTTGTSGAATFVANTLNIPQYTGGGGGGTSFSNRALNRFELFSEFLNRPDHNFEILAPDAIGGYYTGSGSGSSYGTPDANRPGVQTASTGTTSTGTAAYFSGLATSGQFIFSGGEWIWDTAIRIPVLSTSAEEFVIVAGFANEKSGVQMTDAVYFAYDRAGTSFSSEASVNWQVATVTSATRTWFTTSTPVSTGWVKLKIIINSAATSVGFYINNTLVRTQTTNIPGAGRRTGLVTQVMKTAGTTARTFDIDYVSVEANFTTNR